MRFKFVQDLTSDVMFEAYGKDEKELFENCAIALASVICKIDQVPAVKQTQIRIKADSLEDLLIDWLQAIIAAVDTEMLFYSKFEIKKITENELEAVAYGSPVTPELGETVVKAVTYYKFRLEHTGKVFKAVVSLDI